jgi:paraquat-inducible protein B
VVRTGQLGSLQRSSPVYYRGIEVGVVQEATLAPEADRVHVHVLIRRRYAPLVRANSVFWNVSGVSVSGGVFKGVELKLESLRSLAAGGISFATPDARARPARDGDIFSLQPQSRKEWENWSPRIRLPQPKDDDESLPRQKGGAPAVGKE